MTEVETRIPPALRKGCRFSHGELKIKVEACYDGIKTCNQIAKELGVTRMYVHATLSRLNLKPVLEKRVKKLDILDAQLYRLQEELRTIKESHLTLLRNSVDLTSMPANLIDWLEAEKPTGSSTSEFIIAILNDACLDG